MSQGISFDLASAFTYLEDRLLRLFGKDADTKDWNDRHAAKWGGCATSAATRDALTGRGQFVETVYCQTRGVGVN